MIPELITASGEPAGAGDRDSARNELEKKRPPRKRPHGKSGRGAQQGGERRGNQAAEEKRKEFNGKKPYRKPQGEKRPGEPQRSMDAADRQTGAKRRPKRPYALRTEEGNGNPRETQAAGEHTSRPNKNRRRYRSTGQRENGGKPNGGTAE